jgi:hypothetical protein
VNWPKVREAYPDQWLIVEAMEAHTEGNRRLIDRIAVIETWLMRPLPCTGTINCIANSLCANFFVHTSRETLDIEERWWTGIRRKDAAYIEDGFPRPHRSDH